MVYPLVQLFIHAEDPQFIQQNLQIERIGRLRGVDDPVDSPGFQATGLQLEIFSNQLPAFASFKKGYFVLGPVTPADLLQRPPRQCRHKQPQIGRDFRRQPRQVRRPVGVRQLIQGIQNQDNPFLGGCLVKPDLEGIPQFIRLGGNFVLNMKIALELAHNPSEHPHPVSTVRRGADVVLDDEGVGMGFPITSDPVG